MQASQLIFYKDSRDMTLLEDVCSLMEHLEDGFYDKEEQERLFYNCVSGLYRCAGESGFKGNLWHCYLTQILVYNENPYTVASELKGKVEGTLSQAVVHDYRIFMDMFAYDIKKLEEAVGNTKDMTLLTSYEGSGKEAIKYNKFIVEEINSLAVKLAVAKDVSEFKNLLDSFYGSYGVGVFGLHKAFRVERREDKLHIDPIYNIAVTSLDDIVGYDNQKKRLIANTEAFLEGKKANNCLLFGSSGTGKSSSIRAILNQYYGQGLRMIEVYKHQYKELNDLIDNLKIRNYKFIIYLDDLSFEEYETEYKYLKAVIEGGLESKPSNVLIYATSNRRHLVKESVSDKDGGEDMHSNETVEEKLSLYQRFGESIYFGSPEKKEFNNIVTTLAKKYELPVSEDEILLEANKWELTHGGMSGRTARQFIDAMRAKYL